MDFADIPEVVIDSRGGYKFILARIVNRDGGEKLVIRADQRMSLHLRLVQKLLEETDAAIFCLGGGYINCNPVSKEIKIWEASVDYGQEPRERTVELLRRAFPDFKIFAEDKYGKIVASSGPN